MPREIGIGRSVTLHLEEDDQYLCVSRYLTEEEQERNQRAGHGDERNFRRISLDLATFRLN